MYKFILFFLALFSLIQIDGQRSINLGLCDTLPPLFYSKNYESIHIENGMGYCLSPIKLLDERIVNFKNLRSLSFTHNQYEQSEKAYVLPAEIKNLNKLESVYSNIPNAEIFSMKSLKQLSLTIQSNQSLNILVNEGFQNLTNLEELYINFGQGFSNGYSISGISQLKNLKTVYLMRPNQNIVDEVLRNPFLESIEIYSSKDITFDFSNTPNLKVIKLRDNAISEIPASVFACKNLINLTVVYNPIIEIPDEIALLTQLEVLDLNGNQHLRLPEAITNCTKLKKLVIAGNRNLNYVPSNLGDLRALEIIQFDHCNLTSFPSSIENCTNLKHFSLTKNQLKELPIDFTNLKKLETVYLFNNKLRSIPNSLFELPLVTKMSISENELEAVPNSIGRMQELVNLSLFKNNIHSLPSDIGKLKKLEELSLYNNHLDSLPESIVQLKNLYGLHIGDNNLKKLPKKMQKLKKLHSLEIYSNPLSRIPASLYRLPSIWGIWVSKDQTRLIGYIPTKKKPLMIVTD
jgi:Leucine-rich repeat (LRR) protein